MDVTVDGEMLADITFFSCSFFRQHLRLGHTAETLASMYLTTRHNFFAVVRLLLARPHDRLIHTFLLLCEPVVREPGGIIILYNLRPARWNSVSTGNNV